MKKDEITSRLLALKISSWETIPYSSTLQCPNGDDGYFMDENKIYIGWCDTPNGLMKVCECPVCHQRYRFHGVVGDQRVNLERFLVNFYRDIVRQHKKYELNNERN